MGNGAKNPITILSLSRLCCHETILPFQEAFPGFELLFSVKSNPFPPVIAHLSSLGCVMDCLGQDVFLPKSKIGDFITFSNAGSYGYTLSPLLFTSHAPPKEIFVD